MKCVEKQVYWSFDIRRVFLPVHAFHLLLRVTLSNFRTWIFLLCIFLVLLFCIWSLCGLRSILCCIIVFFKFCQEFWKQKKNKIHAHDRNKMKGLQLETFSRAWRPWSLLTPGKAEFQAVFILHSRLAGALKQPLGITVSKGWLNSKPQARGLKRHVHTEKGKRLWYRGITIAQQSAHAWTRHFYTADCNVQYFLQCDGV